MWFSDELRSIGRFSHFDFSFDSSAFFDEKAGTENVAFDISAFGQPDHAFTVDVPKKLTKYSDRFGMDVGFDPAVFTDHEVLLVMRSRALEVTFNKQAFGCRRLALDNKR